MKNRTYIAIDLKSFYASVECVERGLDPMGVNLVVADASRTEKTICLAVSPSLKAYGIPGRARLFEVIQRVERANEERRSRAPGRKFSGTSWLASELKRDPSLAIDYLIAPPRMAFYMDYSTRIYQIYLKYVAPEDIHVYSIDEVFMDVTNYLETAALSAREFAMRIILDVLRTTGITATAGIGTNLYLCKIAMDIEAKHIEPDENGVRIAELDEESYRRRLWSHRPLTDFWRVGAGYARKLEAKGIFTMGDIARCSLGPPYSRYNEELLYKLFGVNAELLIDHAWGWEPCTIADIKAYKPSTNSLSSGQVLACPYSFEKARLIVKEMTDLLVLEIVDKGLATNQMALHIVYDCESLNGGSYSGEVERDHYGRRVPKPVHGLANMERPTSSTRLLLDAVLSIYDRIVDPQLLVRKIYVIANNLVEESAARVNAAPEQLNLFTDYAAREERRRAEDIALAREKQRQKAVLEIKKKFGKNAILRGINLEEGATAKDRNRQIGGHKA